MAVSAEPAQTLVSPRSSVLVGLIGRGIQLSRTPAMHEAEGRAQGIAYIYRLIDADLIGDPAPSISELVRFAEYFGFSGFNVTFPFKQEILPLLDKLSDAARVVGAVNTVVLKDGLRFGHNTDCWGFAESFRRDMAGVPLDRVVQFGAGGAGAAVAYALIKLGVRELAIVDSQPGRAERLAERLNIAIGGSVRAETNVQEAVAAADGLVNATPVGMAQYPGMPFPGDLLASHHWVAEIVYFPRETELLRHARRLGCKVLPGMGMAIGQAVRAFELFTGRTTDITAMARHFEAAA
ncbi:shikimate dehydrogenase [Chelativorans xinjiangense]|uniref:shikimate dehydrogenase n=1 Tax=Chelativorans xinjiangense TaxID=2681485 RepID=UPI0019168347|nr:shikimate dehydrogenase [Chelativorans xinjiangense]